MSEHDTDTIDPDATGGDDRHEDGRGDIPARQLDFEIDGPLEIDIAVGAGHIKVQFVDQPGARVEIRHDQTAGDQWVPGLSSLLSWVSGQFGGPQEGSPEDAVHQSRVDLVGSRLVIRNPKAPALRGVPLDVLVRAPSGSHLGVKSGSARLVTSGRAGRLHITSGTGDITVDRADGMATVACASATVRLGPMPGGARIKTGAGDIDISSIGAPSMLFSGTGDVWLGAVQADLMVRTASGDITVADAARGTVELATGSGELQVAVRKGATAMVDLKSHSGQATSELEVTETPPSDEPALRIRGRTGSGNATITRAAG
ncbi:MAG: DUF4097 family beta strand repeat protein [Kutzneria sp.]|nr:DUF4097 family beta strand repeat protein [Kutzneria sp.]